MLFNSAEYLVFLPLVAAVHFRLPRTWRWVWLLAASYYFYISWEPAYALLLLWTTTVDYAVGRAVYAARGARVRGALLAVTLTANLGVLFTFKYYGFFRETLRALADAAGLEAPLPAPEWLLPVGISFYTFQSLSYTFDVYRGIIIPERNFARFALFVSFFPQLVAGPIERAKHLLPQLRCLPDFSYPDTVEGLRRILLGLVKKVVVADNLAVIVNNVYAAPEEHAGPALLIATLAFAFQIYCDFSGYSDIAIGTARIFGVRLMENFRQPYLAPSLADFWRRWHISLSTWFRDYLYVPLGGNRSAPAAWATTVLLVFLVSGLWHGAAWTFVIWGAIHGAGLVLERALSRRNPEAPRRTTVWRVVRTFVLVNAAWVFFRAESLGDALAVFRGLPQGWGALAQGQAFIETLGVSPAQFALAVLLALGVLAADRNVAAGPFSERLNTWPAPARWVLYSAGLWAIFLWGVLRSEEFIYFQF